MLESFKTWGSALALTLGLAGLTGCQQTANTPEQADEHRQFSIIGINDVYNIEGTDARQAGGMARLRSLRDQMSTPDEPVLLLHGGDFLFPSSMSSQYKGAQMVDLMNYMDGDGEAFDERFFAVFGNHEFDKGRAKDAKMMGDRIEQSDFYWLGSNVEFDDTVTRDSAAYQKALIKNHITTINGVKVGLFGIVTNIVVPAYGKIDGNYEAVARREIANLRARGAEVVIAVTHLQIDEDADLLKALGEDGPDVVFGGHEHARQHVCVGRRCVLKADADVRSATVATVNVSSSGEVDVSHYFAVLDNTTIEEDEAVLAVTNRWMDRYQNEYCAANNQPEGCLMKVLGRTDTTLIGEELEIRRFETNLGAYSADLMMAPFKDMKLPGGKKVQVGLINAGSLRLNQNIPAGTELNDWYVNGIFQYPVNIRILELDGKTLKQVLNRSVEVWAGNGWYLHVSGLAFRHDVANERVTDIHLIDENGKLSPLKDSDTVVAAINAYMTDPGTNQDGYTMLNLDNEIKYADKLLSLKDVFREAVREQWLQGKAIAPVAPGRVCTSMRPNEPCLLDSLK